MQLVLRDGISAALSAWRATRALDAREHWWRSARTRRIARRIGIALALGATIAVGALQGARVAIGAAGMRELAQSARVAVD